MKLFQFKLLKNKIAASKYFLFAFQKLSKLINKSEDDMDLIMYLTKHRRSWSFNLSP